MSHPARALYVFLQMTQNTFLAVVILNAQTVLYPHYATVQRAWGPTPLEDQQIAAAFMWVVGDMIFLVADLRDPRRLVACRGSRRRPDGPAGGRGAGRHPRPGEATRRTLARERGRGDARSSAGEWRLEIGPVGRRVDVAAARDSHRDDRRPSTPSSVAAECDRGDGQGTRRLDDQPRPLRGEPDAGGDLRLGDGHDVVEVRAQVSERPRAERLGAGAVGDRPGHIGRGPADDLAAAQRVAGIGRQLRLDADDADVRAGSP